MSEKQSEEKPEVLNKQDVEAEREREEVRQVVAEVVRSEFSGPIPPPSIIKGYEEVLPGAAERIISMAENQAKHRQDLEKKMVAAEVRDSLLGVLFAFFLGIGCIAAAIVIVILVPQNSGAISSSALGIAGIGSIIATFIKSTRSNRNTNKNESKKNETKTAPQLDNENN